MDTVVEPVRKQIKTTAINTSALPFFRFFAACIVVFSHFGQQIKCYQSVPAIFKAGPQMVTFFFVLSGFVLFLGYQQRVLKLREYSIKRAIRILPLYLVAFSISVILKASWSKVSFVEFFLNLFCLQSWFPNPLSLNAPAWFVSDLVFFYCVFPLILFALNKIRPDGMKIVIVSLLLWVITQGILIMMLNSDFYRGYPSYSHDLIFAFPLSHFCSFFMGICGACFVKTNDVIKQRGEVMSLLMTLLIFGSVGLLVQYQPELTKLAGVNIPFGSSFYAPIFIVFILNITQSRNSLLRILSWSPFMFLGNISYAFYILQVPMYDLYNYLIFKHFVLQPGMNFLVFLTFLLLTSMLLTFLEKIIVRRIRITI